MTTVVSGPIRIESVEWHTDGSLTLRWSGVPASETIAVEFSPNLQPPDWQDISGPITGNSWTAEPSPEVPRGFYRLRAR